MTAPLRIPEPLATAWSKILSGSPLSSVREELARQGLLQGLAIEAAVEGTRLRFDFSSRITPYAELLRRLEPLQLSIAPEILSVKGDPRDAALLLQYRAVSGEPLRKMRDGALPAPAEAIERVRRDLHALWGAGLDHRYALRGLTCWLQGERSGTIVLDSWDALGPLDASERDEKIASLDARLAELPRA